MNVIGHKYKHRIFQFIYNAKKPVRNEILVKNLKIPINIIKQLLIELQQEGKIKNINCSGQKNQNGWIWDA